MCPRRARWRLASLTTRAPPSCPSPTAWAPGSSSPLPAAATSLPLSPGASTSCRSAPCGRLRSLTGFLMAYWGNWSLTGGLDPIWRGPSP
uniref:Secreted protein n=1 Tax=Falco tinnunculus TaxID=100819 RepID=A0A8C4XQF9_FALTI